MTIDAIKMGNLGKAIEFVPAKGSTQARAKGMIFCDRGFMRDGTWQESGTDIVNFTAWGSMAEHLNSSQIAVGTRLLVVGEFVSSEVENDQGKRTFWEIKVTDIGPSAKFATVSSVKVAKATTTQTTSAEPNVADQIAQLAQLNTAGVLSDEEFNRSKSALLATITGAPASEVSAEAKPKSRKSKGKGKQVQAAIEGGEEPF